MDYTFKNTVSNQTIYISGINTEILDLQKYVEVLIINWNHCVICYLFSCRSINRTYIRPINEVTYATSLIADGYYHVRVPESNVERNKSIIYYYQ